MNFRFVIQDRFRDILYKLREISKKMAKSYGHCFTDTRNVHYMLQYYVPKGIERTRWKDMCRQWHTTSWLKKSDVRKKSRNSRDAAGKISRHMGGNVGFDEHRLKLTSELGREPTFLEVFERTHFVKNSKVNHLFQKNKDENQFCTDKAKVARETYFQVLLEKYGGGILLDDVDIWLKTQADLCRSPRTRYIYGIGSSDLEYVVTGRSSAAGGRSPYSCWVGEEEVKTKFQKREAEKDFLQEEQDQSSV